MKVFLGRAPIVMVADPDQARKVLLKNADRKNPFSGAALARNPDQVEFDKASLINSGWVLGLAGTKRQAAAAIYWRVSSMLPTSSDDVTRHVPDICRAEKAKGLRGAWQPTFNPSAIAEYTGTMNKAISKLLARLQKAEIERSEVNIWRLFGDLTFDVVGTCAFGWVPRQLLSPGCLSLRFV